jgi:amino acid permease
MLHDVCYLMIILEQSHEPRFSYRNMSSFSKKCTSFDCIEQPIHENERTGSSIGAYFNIICVIAGTGTLQLPLAMSQSGWIGVLLIALSAAMAIYTGHILIRCLYIYPGRRLEGYSEIGREAFGKPGYYIVQFFNYTLMLGVGCIFIMLTGTQTYKLLSDAGINVLEERAWIAIAGLVVLMPLIVIKSLKEAAILSAFGTLTTMIVVIVTTTLSILDMQDPHDSTAQHTIVNPSQLAMAIASISFSFGGNVVYPHVERTMRHPGSWTRVLSMAILTIMLSYMMIAIPSYMAYGESVQSPIFINLPKGTATTCAIILMTVHVILTAPVILTSFSLDIENIWGIHAVRIGRIRAWLYRTLFRIITVLVLTCIAMTVPFFGDFMSLLGAFANCMTIFVLPVACYLSLVGWRNIACTELIWSALVVVIGMFGCVLGAIDAIKALHKNFNESEMIIFQ